MPQDDLIFNHEIQADLFWIGSYPVLHIIDRGTRYSVAKFIDNFSAEHVWNLIVEHWVCIFSGFPDILSHDQGTQFTLEFFQSMCAEFAIDAKQTPEESHNSPSICERYHPLIRRIFRNIRVDFPDTESSLTLSLAVDAANTTAGLDGLTTSLLLFRVSPKLPITDLELSPQLQKDSFAAMEAARMEMLTITAQCRLKAAVEKRFSAERLFTGSEGNQVLAYREDSKSWERALTPLV